MAEKNTKQAEQEQGEAPDLILPDGTEITFDLTKMSLTEWRALWDPKKSNAEEEDKIISKVAGLTVEDLQALDFITWKRLINAFYEASRRPVSPN